MKKYEYCYSKTEDIEIELEEADILRLALIAHERDITLNSLIVEILEGEVNRLEGELLG